MTVTVEVEMILNSRPLSYLSSDDIDEPPMPTYLVHGRRLMSPPNRNFTGDLTRV